MHFSKLYNLLALSFNFVYHYQHFWKNNLLLNKTKDKKIIKIVSPLWFTFWFSLIFKELWLVNVFFWLIHQSLISWFYYLIEYSGVWSVINHVATYQYLETLIFRPYFFFLIKNNYLLTCHPNYLWIAKIQDLMEMSVTNKTFDW